MKTVFYSLTLLLFFSSYAQTSITLPKNDNENDTKIYTQGSKINITWNVSKNEQYVLVLSTIKNTPLIKSIQKLDLKNKTVKKIAQNLQPNFVLRTGERTLNDKNGWTIFFDKVPTRPYQTELLAFNQKDIDITKHKNRTVISISEINSSLFKGHLEITIYNNTPFFNIAAVVKTQKDATAILYDAGLSSSKPFDSIAYFNTDKKLVEKKSTTSGSKEEAVRYRAIAAKADKGSLVVFPAPHQYFYPLDEAFNLNSVWHGTDYLDIISPFSIGIRQAPEGDHRFVPWFNAPPNTEQRLQFFCMLSEDTPETALNEVAKLTRKDTYQPLEGYQTLASHFHNEFIMNEVIPDKPTPKNPEFVSVFKDMGVNIVHLGEFHYTAHPKGPDHLRLQELKALFDECGRLSDDNFLLLPGEEPNEFLGGHWMAFFPKPVYWIMDRKDNQPFISTEDDYGTVYRIKNKEEMLQLLEKEQGLAWTAHPRIKGSTGYPDAYKNEDFFLSDRFFGGAWKAMPADLSLSKLGTRVLDLQDDMNNWGTKKHILAESDLFTITKENEMYAHMNINYVQLPKLPSFSEGWGDILKAVNNGKFFSTTGEILIPSFSINGKEAGETITNLKQDTATLKLSLDWTFPLNYIEVISGDGKQTFREKIDVNDTSTYGEKSFSFPIHLKDRKWVRVEVWDIAANGAFTQTIYIE